MLVVTAPEQVESFAEPSIFLAGAITNAPNWQPQAAKLLTPAFATAFNPRRPAGFLPPEHPEYLQSYTEQVQWEHRYLPASSVVLFWLPKEALAITTRFELGWYFGMLSSSNQADRRRFVVGIEPGVFSDLYYRIVLPQVGIPVHETLEATCRAAVKLITAE
jgi:hypothetical protein